MSFRKSGAPVGPKKLKMVSPMNIKPKKNILTYPMTDEMVALVPVTMNGSPENWTLGIVTSFGFGEFSLCLL